MSKPFNYTYLGQSSFTAYLLQLSKQSILMAVLPFTDIQLNFKNAISFFSDESPASDSSNK